MVAREEELIQRIIKGDRKASFVLYHRYARQMLNVAFRILKETCSHCISDVASILQNAHGISSTLLTDTINNSLDM